jgi:hypothetical protein
MVIPRLRWLDRAVDRPPGSAIDRLARISHQLSAASS